MKKALYLLIFILQVLLWAGNAAAQDSQRYVRQKVQPNFFIPNGALAESKPEKVFVPRYRKGQTTAKHISADDNLYAARPVYQKPKTAPKTDNQPIYNSDTETDSYDDKPATPAPSQIDDGTPDYQKMYQDYLKDLDSIAKTGDVKDQAVLDDLSVMNSEKRIELDKKFNKKRNLAKDIQAALEK